MRIVTLGHPVAHLGRPSQLGMAWGPVVGSIISAATTLTMSTIQIIYTEIQARRARRQWKSDQASRETELAAKLDQMDQQNRDLQSYLDSMMNPVGPTTGTTGIAATAQSFLASPLMPYVALGGVGFVVVLLLMRREK